MARNGYGAIPQGGQAKNELLQNAKDRYPEANEDEAELLGLLDDVIEKGANNIAVKLPSVKRDEVDISTNLFGFLYSLTLPTSALLVTGGVALWIGTGSALSSNVVSFFPYVAAVIGFLFSFVPMQQRYTQQSRQIFSLVRSTQSVAETTVDDVVMSVAASVDDVNMKLTTVVEAMRPKLRHASKYEKSLKQMDPNLKIPNPNTVEHELDGAKDEINESIQFMEETMSVTPWIPAHLTSPKAYQAGVVNKVLFVCLVLQLVGVYATLVYLENCANSSCHNSLEEENRLGRGLKWIFFFDHAKVDERVAMFEEAWPCPVAFAIEVYVMAIVQLGIIYFALTSACATAAMTNRMRAFVSNEINLVLRRHGITFLCQDVLEIRMGRVRKKVLNMISVMFKIDMLMEMTEGNSLIPRASPSSPKKRITNLFGTP